MTPQCGQAADEPSSAVPPAPTRRRLGWDGAHDRGMASGSLYLSLQVRVGLPGRRSRGRRTGCGTLRSDLVTRPGQGAGRSAAMLRRQRAAVPPFGELDSRRTYPAGHGQGVRRHRRRTRPVDGGTADVLRGHSAACGRGSRQRQPTWPRHAVGSRATRSAGSTTPAAASRRSPICARTVGSA